MSKEQVLARGRAQDRVDADGYTHGYCDPDGNFLGYADYMTLIPGLIPAKRHVQSGIVVPTGNQKILPKGRVLTTDAGFGPGGASEQVLDGLVDDKGGGLAPTGAIPGTAIPDNEGPQLSPELQAKIEARNASKTAPKEAAASKEAKESKGDKAE